MEYILLYSNYILNTRMQKPALAFLKGFKTIVNLNWLKMLNQDELQLIISGKKGLNVEDLRNNCILNGYHKNNKTIVFLWEILISFNEDEQALFMLFVTGCSRPPTIVLLIFCSFKNYKGFSYLDPPFTIQKVDFGEDLNSKLQITERIPTSQTCINMLNLPDYNDKKKLEDKLRYAINSKSGFDLS